ncbi:GRC3 protein [Coccidioides immitis RMSCC 2394]|uniref:Polynucleotide 5'-hydroxyl-kinase GRC3 n=1 Tax=Coccidioides immitis RMSCC 2394 TaxID=404692 RepID=A0A0J6Y2F4_COCIT|nr:GRC3 protein [Coccidioides immitis RMSCC 2394]
MKRKAGDQPVLAVSAIAARRRAQQNAAVSTRSSVSKPISASEAEPPLKRSKPSLADDLPSSPAVKSKIEVVIRNPKRQSNRSQSTIAASIEEQTRSTDDDKSGILVEDNGGVTSSESSDEIEVSGRENYENFLLSKGAISNKDVLYKTNDTICIRLREKTTITVLGQYDLWIKRGVVSIFGAKLPPSTQIYRVYAPSTHSLPVIKTVAGVDGYAEIEISSCRNGLPYLRHVSDLYRRIWSGKQASSGNRLTTGSGRSFSIVKNQNSLHSSSEDPFKRHLRPLHFDKQWSMAIKALSSRGAHLRVMTCGPKGSGKSTFNKYLVNHLLSQIPPQNGKASSSDGVAYIDLDPGQPEFSPPGEVYLAHLRRPVLGPSFSHPVLVSPYDGSIVKSHHIGATSPKDDPNHYVLCVMDLLNRYRVLLQSYPQCPAVINYPGWIFGQGLEIATWFIRSLDLSDVVYMSVQGPEEVILPLREAASEAGVPVTTLPSQPTEYATRSSAQLRSMQVLSYFHVLQNDANIPFWSDLPIQHHRTMSVSYSGENPGIFGIMVTGFHHEPDRLHDLLDGSLVGVVAVEDSGALPKSSDTATATVDTHHHKYAANRSDPDQDAPMNDADSAIASSSPHPLITQVPHTNLPYLFIGSGTCHPLDPASSYSVGLALVRSIDIQSQTIHLITPIPPKSLHSALDRGHRIILVRGNLDNPNWALSEQYFAARAAQRKVRQRRAEVKAESDDSELLRGYEDKIRRSAERVRRATRGAPWMTVARQGEKKQKERNGRLWKVTKPGQDGGSDGESEHF